MSEVLDPPTTEDLMRTLNANLAAGGYPYKLAVVDPRDLHELDKNAHYMTHEVFKNLVENVRQDGALASVPFCWFDGLNYHTLSGNHRVKAAIAAGVTQVLILYDDRPLTREQRVAIQLSHNSINGKDDPAILKELWTEINDLSLKYYSGWDDKALEQLANASLKAMNEATLDYKAVQFLFLPEEVEHLEAAFKTAAATVSAADAYLLPAREFERLIDALDKTKAAFHTKNHAVAFMLVLNVFEQHLQDLQEGWVEDAAAPELKTSVKHTGHVPLASVLGTDKIPAQVAMLLKRCHDRIGSGSDGKKDPWKTIEVLAERYLKSS